MALPRKRSRLSFVRILVANLASVVVIRGYGWNVHALLIVYWLETGVVTATYAAKINRAEGTDDPETIRSWTKFDGKRAEWYIGKANRTVADALVLNFVGPWLAWGLVAFLLGVTDELELANPVPVVLATTTFVISHGFSYWYEYIGQREYERRGPVSLLVEPAPRFWALALTLIFGMGATSIARSSVGLLVVLVFFKTCVDLLSHRRERKRALA